MSNLLHDSHKSAQLERGRKAARRTAWLFAGIAFVVYAGFLLIVAVGK